MSRVLHRYLGRELLSYWLVFTLVLWLVLVAARFSLYLSQAAAGQLPADTVLSLLAFKSVGFLVFLMPLGLFLGLLALLGRLNRDYEALVLGASGMGPWHWYRAIRCAGAGHRSAGRPFEREPGAAHRAAGLPVARRGATRCRYRRIDPGPFSRAAQRALAAVCATTGPQPNVLEDVFVYAAQSAAPAGAGREAGAACRR